MNIIGIICAAHGWEYVDYGSLGEAGTYDADVVEIDEAGTEYPSRWTLSLYP